MSTKKRAEEKPWGTLERMRGRLRRELGSSRPSLDGLPRVYNKRRGDAPAGAVYIGRPGPWGNPIKLRDQHDERERSECMQQYVDWLYAPEQAEFRARVRKELRGKHLVCWCAPDLCHGDPLLALANEDALLQGAVEWWKQANGVLKALVVETIFNGLRRRLPDAHTTEGLLTTMLPSLLTTLVPRAMGGDVALVFVGDDDLRPYDPDAVPEGERHVVMPWELYSKICERSTMERMVTEVGAKLSKEEAPK